MLPTSLFAYGRCVSSAYILGLQFDKNLEVNFCIIRITVNRGWSTPHPLPRGTPQVSTLLSDKDPLTEHCCVRFSKNSQIYHKGEALLDIRVLWSTISKAFSRSRKITALIFSMSILYAQESVTSSKAVTVQ